MDSFAGLDVSVKDTSVCIVDGTGQIVREVKVASEPDALLAVLANVAYCAAYLPDLFAQASGFRDSWRRYRWILFAIGLLFAGVITRYWAIAFFLSAG